MGGGKGGGGVDPAVQQGMLANETALTQIAQEQAVHGTELFSAAFPGFQTSENFYQSLASGDPEAIMKAIAPAAQQDASAAAGAKTNIMQNAPAGGEKNLALAMTDVQKAGAVAGTGTSASLGANNALAQLAGQGVGESISAAGAGANAYSAGSNSLAQLGSLQNQAAEIQAQEKGSMLGAASSLAGTGAEVAMFAMA